MVSVTNRLSLTHADTYNGARVGIQKHVPAPFGPVACLFAAPGANPVLINGIAVLVVNTRHRTQG